MRSGRVAPRTFRAEREMGTMPRPLAPPDRVAFMENMPELVGGM
jgi:hypothetical protein